MHVYDDETMHTMLAWAEFGDISIARTDDTEPLQLIRAER
jgi:hypothetical protein